MDKKDELYNSAVRISWTTGLLAGISSVMVMDVVEDIHGHYAVGMGMAMTACVLIQLCRDILVLRVKKKLGIN